jgi:hypothetical protein
VRSGMSASTPHPTGQFVGISNKVLRKNAVRIHMKTKSASAQSNARGSPAAGGSWHGRFDPAARLFRGVKDLVTRSVVET